MVELLPNSEYRKRGKCPVKEMCDAAVKRGFTNLLIFTEVTLTLALTLILARTSTLALILARTSTLALTLTLTLPPYQTHAAHTQADDHPLKSL